MRKFLAIMVLALLGMPVRAIDESTPNLNLFHASKLYGAERLPATWEAYALQFLPEVQADVYWTNYGDLAVVGISQTVFADRAEQDAYFADMDLYFDTVFQHYSPYQIEATCGTDDVVLREFTAVNGGEDYLIKHYIEQTDRYETRTIGLYFPSDLATEMTETAALFYPDLLSCTED